MLARDTHEQPAIRQPVQLGEEIATYVREGILSGQFAPGTQLNIDRLARQLSVSSTPVREALLALRSQGFVVFQPRRGFAASAVTPGDLADLYWMQSELAGELARRATERADDALHAGLAELQGQIAAALDIHAYEQVEALNFALHRQINLRAGAPKLLWMLRLLLQYVPRRFYGSVPGWAEASANDHTAIIAALHRRDANAAQDAMKAHIINAGALLAENLRRQGELARDPGAGPRAEEAEE